VWQASLIKFAGLSAQPHKMSLIINLPEPDDWVDSMPINIAYVCIDQMNIIRKHFEWYRRHAARLDMKVSSYEILRDLGLYMPREKKKNGTASDNGVNNGRSAGSGVKWQWGNCKLSNEDISSLERDTSSLEYLASCLVALGADGYGFSCKPVDQGESHCCTIYRPDYPSKGNTVGVSSFGGNIRDAILTCLYKLDHYGGGDFSGFDLEMPAEGTKPRFR
jgi:hypothetical protein